VDHSRRIKKPSMCFWKRPAELSLIACPQCGPICGGACDAARRKDGHQHRTGAGLAALIGER